MCFAAMLLSFATALAGAPEADIVLRSLLQPIKAIEHKKGSKVEFI